ncbi:MAG: DUF3786 domain-containing protein [Pseudomonadota bacterium]
MEQAEVFERIYQDYLAEIARVDLGAVQAKLGFSVEGDEAVIPILGRPHRVSGRGIAGPDGSRPTHAVAVILSKYLILCPEFAPTAKEWVAYKDFKDATPFAAGFRDTAETPLARRFGGDLPGLEQAGQKLGGRRAEEDYSCELAMVFQPLPQVPILMIFYDRDEEFPARCSLLFERRAAKYLDPECLAMCGMVLSAWLQRAG